MDDNKEKIAALKIILGSLEYQNISIIKTMKNIMKYLCDYFESSSEKKYIEIALLHIKAYIEMGFVYDELKDEFDYFFNMAGESKNEIFLSANVNRAFTKGKSKSEIKSMIRRWSSSKYHTKSIDEVVEDIVQKVENRSIGIYYYHSNENPKNPRADEVYELVIGEFESYLHDINRNKYYKLA